jgi:hypothetical protein
MTSTCLPRVLFVLLTQGIVNVAAVAAALRQRRFAPAKPAPAASPEPRDAVV